LPCGYGREQDEQQKDKDAGEKNEPAAGSGHDTFYPGPAEISVEKIAGYSPGTGALP